MPRFPTFPTLYEECKTVSISDLKRWSYLKTAGYKSGVITWSRNGQKTASIGISVNTVSENPYMELDYTCDKQPINYHVQLITVPSNLGKGNVWYFICPKSGKRCRKLYLVDTYFYHRSAFSGCFYEAQTQSSKTRTLLSLYSKIFSSDQLYQQIYSKHFKSSYSGKPTKRYLNLIQKIKKAESIPYTEEDLLMM